MSAPGFALVPNARAIEDVLQSIGASRFTRIEWSRETDYITVTLLAAHLSHCLPPVEDLDEWLAGLEYHLQEAAPDYKVVVEITH
jgi:hypothetical protein